jgi:RND family efflux transporter MFP subunit
MSRTDWNRAVAAAGAGLLGVAVSACSSASKPAAPEPSAAVGVTVAMVSMADRADTFEVGGVVQARTTATLAARIMAPVLEVRVAPGDRVRAGQVLLVLDGRDLDARSRGARADAQGATQGATAAEAEERAAQAAQALTRATFDRIAALQAKRSATAQELDAATAALRGAEARLAGATARVQEAGSRVESTTAASQAAAATESYTRITAPFDGLVTEKFVEPGNMAAPGMPLLRLEDTRSFRLDVRVDESRLGQVAPGAAVDVGFDVNGDAPSALKGVVSEIGRAVDADARAFLVKVDLPGGLGLRSGMFGRARFTGAARQTLIVPPDAVVRQGQVTSVFVVDGGVARLRLVQVSGDDVRSGLAAGESVVVSPPPGLADGRRVTTGNRP